MVVEESTTTTATTSTSDNPFVCYIHGYSTFDVNEWNDHCEETGHTMSGTTVCVDCDVSIPFENVPYKRITPTGYNLNVTCGSCTDAKIQELQDNKVQFKQQEGENNQ